jgi:hypothetical protein
MLILDVGELVKRTQDMSQMSHQHVELAKSEGF